MGNNEQVLIVDLITLQFTLKYLGIHNLVELKVLTKINHWM